METGPNRTIREPRRFVKKSLWVVGCGLPVVAASGSGPSATCNLQPATGRILTPPPTHRVRDSLSPRGPRSPGIELRSADFSPRRSGAPKTAGSGLKSALLSSRNSLNSMAVRMEPLRWWRYQDAPTATAKNFPALTSTVFSATFPPLEKENLRTFSCD